MTLKHALRELFDRFIRSRGGRNRRPVRLARSRPLILEQLETRLTPATHVWSGATSTLWSVNGNWSSGGSPAGDSSPDLIFPASGVTRYTSKDDLAASTAIKSITFNDRGFDLVAAPDRTLVLATDITATNMSGGNTIEINISLTAADHTMMVAGDGVLNVVKGVYFGGVGKTLIKSGAGELVFTNDSNTYSNNTDVKQGTLTALGVNSTGYWPVSGMTVDSGATLVAYVTSVGSLAGGGNVVLTGPGGGIGFGYDNTSTDFSGVISGQGGISKYGSGMQILSGQNTYAGLVTDIQVGTLRLGVDNALPSNAIVYLVPGNGCTFDLANHSVTIAALSGGTSTENVKLGTGTLAIKAVLADPRTFNGVISGSGSLVKDGSTAQRLGGNNTYTGSTTIAGGTLEVNGNQPLSAVTVSAGAVLSGTGTVGSTTVFGTLRPGSAANPAGTLSVAGNVTFSGSSAKFAVELDGTGAGQYSQLNATGTVDLGTATTLQVTIGYAASSGDTFSSVITSANLVGTFSAVPAGMQDSYSATNLDLSIL
jgi:autotransporter-associated beta strand protein